MIIGIGSDLCDIRRIEKTLERFGQRFIDRTFTAIEQAKAEWRTGKFDIVPGDAEEFIPLPQDGPPPHRIE